MRKFFTRFAATATAVMALAPASAESSVAPYGSATTSSQGYSPLKYVVESTAFEPSDVANCAAAPREADHVALAQGSTMSVVIIGGRSACSLGRTTRSTSRSSRPRPSYGKRA